MTPQTHMLVCMITNRANTQREVAYAYRCALLLHEDFVEWPLVNAAILKRWSATGLKRIQRAEKE